jgi:hypothetical protein
MRAIDYQHGVKMPPSGKLKDEEIAAIGEWIRMGAPWPPEKAAAMRAPVRQTTPRAVSPNGAGK